MSRLAARRADEPRMSRVSLWYVAACVPVAVAYGLLPADFAKLVIWPIFGWSSVIAILVGVAANRPEPRLPWYLLAAGVATFIIGDDLYSVRTIIQHNPAPFPSYIDIVYLAMYPLLIGGLALLVHHRSAGRDRSTVIDACIITAGLGLVSWALLIAPNIRSGEFSVLERLTSIAYPIGDIVLLATAVRLAVGGGRRPGAFWLLAGGLVGLLAADGLFGYLNLSGTFTEHSLLDVGWIAFYVAWGTAALHPSMRDLSAPTRSTEPTTVGRIVVVGSAVLVPPLMLFIQDVRGVVTDATAIALTGALLFVLVLVRIVGLVRNTAEAKSEARFRALIDKTSDAIVVVDGQGKIRYHTPSTEQVLGRSPSA